MEKEIKGFNSLTDELKAMYAFRTIFLRKYDFDDALRKCICEGWNREKVLKNVAKNFKLLSEWSGYDQESNMKIVLRPIEIMLQEEVSFDNALCKYCYETKSNYNAIEGWFPEIYFQTCIKIDGYLWVMKNK